MKDSIATTKDPVCGMTVNEKTSLHAERDGQTFYFCSEHCRQRFLAQAPPQKPNGPTGGHDEDGCCGGSKA